MKIEERVNLGTIFCFGQDVLRECDAWLDFSKAGLPGASGEYVFGARY